MADTAIQLGFTVSQTRYTGASVATLRNVDRLTVAFWYKPSSTDTGTSDIFGCSGTDAFKFVRSSNGLVIATMILASGTQTITFRLVTDEWAFIRLSYDANRTTKQYRLHVNEKLCGWVSGLSGKTQNTGNSAPRILGGNSGQTRTIGPVFIWASNTAHPTSAEFRAHFTAADPGYSWSVTPLMRLEMDGTLTDTPSSLANTGSETTAWSLTQGAAGTLVSPPAALSRARILFWPGTAYASRTVIDSGTEDWSDIVYHPVEDKIFAVDNTGLLWTYNPDGTSPQYCRIGPSSDIEGICYANEDDGNLYILSESSSGRIFEVAIADVLAAVDNDLITPSRTWDTTSVVPGDTNNGVEAITFIPVTGHAEGGVFAVGTQNNGKVYYLELKIVTSAVDTTVTHLTSAPYYSPANTSISGQTDLASLHYLRDGSELLMALYDSPNRLTFIEPFPGSDSEPVIYAEMTEPSAVAYEGVSQGSGDLIYFTNDSVSIDRYALDWSDVYDVINPPAPTLIFQEEEVGTAHASQATFGWTASTGGLVSGYKLYYGTTQQADCRDYPNSSETATTGITLTGLSAETTYYGAIVSVNEDGTETRPADAATLYFTTGPSGLPASDGSRIYGTSGANSNTGGTAWTSPGNVNGDAADDSSPATLVLASELAPDSLIASVPATPIDGTLVGVKIGVRAGASVGPHASHALQPGVISGNDWALAIDETNDIFQLDSGTIADYEFTAYLQYGTYAQVQSSIEAGITASLNNGFVLGGTSPTGNTTFQVVEIWLTPVVAPLLSTGIVGGIGASGKTKTLPIGVVLP